MEREDWQSREKDQGCASTAREELGDTISEKQGLCLWPEQKSFFGMCQKESSCII